MVTKQTSQLSNKIIKDQKTSFFVLRSKLVTNPSYHTLEYLEDKIETKLNNLKESFLNTIKEQANKTKITDGKCRTIKIVLGCEKEKESLMSNLSALKNNDMYKGISITEDLTQSQRMAYKQLANGAKTKNMNDTPRLHLQSQRKFKKQILPKEDFKVHKARQEDKESTRITKHRNRNKKKKIKQTSKI